MTHTDVYKFRRILEGNVIELTKATRRRDAIMIEHTAEELDRILRANERELAVRTLETESARLREVRAALRRIEDGSYGICQECDEPISPKRLAAVPAATMCIRCQQEADCRCGARNERPYFAMAA